MATSKLHLRFKVPPAKSTRSTRKKKEADPPIPKKKSKHLNKPLTRTKLIERNQPEPLHFETRKKSDTRRKSGASKKKKRKSKETASKEPKPIVKKRKSVRTPSNLLVILSPTSKTGQVLPIRETENKAIPTALSILQNLRVYNRTHEPEFDSILAAGSLPHTQGHESKINSVLDDFHKCLLRYANKKWEDALTIVDFDGPGTIKQAPRILVQCGGEKSKETTDLVNYALIDWMATTCKKETKTNAKKKKATTKNDKFPWYQPSTQSQHLRVFMGVAQKVFGWDYTLSDFSFNEGLIGFLSNLYTTREKEFGHVSQLHIY